MLITRRPGLKLLARLVIIMHFGCYTLSYML